MVSFYRRTGKTRKYIWQKIFSSKKFRLLAKKVCFFLHLNIVLKRGPVLALRSLLHFWVQYMMNFLSFDRMGVLRLIWMVRKSVFYCSRKLVFLRVWQWSSGLCSVKSTIEQSEFSCNCFSLLITLFTFDFFLTLPSFFNWAKNADLVFFWRKKNFKEWLGQFWFAYLTLVPVASMWNITDQQFSSFHNNCRVCT